MKNTVDNICNLLYQKKYREAESQLISYIEETLFKKNGLANSNQNRETYLALYRLFNNYYLNWLKTKKIRYKKGKLLFRSNGHTNLLISKTSQVAEMDDMLFELGNYLDNTRSTSQKNEVLYHLHCYKKGLAGKKSG